MNMETGGYQPDIAIENQDGALIEKIKNIDTQVASLLAEWSRTNIDDKGSKLTEEDLKEADRRLVSLLKQQINTIRNDPDPEKNELYAFYLLYSTGKGINNIDGRATQNAQKYIKEGMAEFHVPGMAEALRKAGIIII